MYKEYLGRATVLAASGIIFALTTTTAQATVTRLVGQNTPIPNGQPGDTFILQADAVIDGDTFAFRGAKTFTDLPAGVYRGSVSTGVFSVVLD